MVETFQRHFRNASVISRLLTSLSNTSGMFASSRVFPIINFQAVTWKFSAAVSCGDGKRWKKGCLMRDKWRESNGRPVRDFRKMVTSGTDPPLFVMDTGRYSSASPDTTSPRRRRRRKAAAIWQELPWVSRF